MLGIWFVFLFVLNLLTPTQGDELGDPKLFLPMQSYGGEVVFGGIESAYGAFMNWNPRLGNLILVSYMAGLANMAFYFDFLNACVGTGFIFLIFFLIYGRIPKDFHDSVILIVIVFFFLLYSFTRCETSICMIFSSLTFLYCCILSVPLSIPEMQGTPRTLPPPEASVPPAESSSRAGPWPDSRPRTPAAAER